MSAPLQLIVTDTSPLITLAAAGELDLLLRPELSLSIPDAVYVEATRVRSALGASAIIDWLNDRQRQVRIAPTEIGIDQLRRLEEGRSIRGMGEAAALETLDRFIADNDGAGAMLLFEDSDIVRRRALVDVRISLVSTGDFLRELEAAGLIQSSDYVLDKAALGGRKVDRQRRGASENDALLYLRTTLRDARRS